MSLFFIHNSLVILFFFSDLLFFFLDLDLDRFTNFTDSPDTNFHWITIHITDGALSHFWLAQMTRTHGQSAC